MWHKRFFGMYKKICHTWLDPQKPTLYTTCCLTNAHDMNLQEGRHLSISKAPFLLGQSVWKSFLVKKIFRIYFLKSNPISVNSDAHISIFYRYSDICIVWPRVISIAFFYKINLSVSNLHYSYNNNVAHKLCICQICKVCNS